MASSSGGAGPFRSGGASGSSGSFLSSKNAEAKQRKLVFDKGDGTLNTGLETLSKPAKRGPGRPKKGQRAVFSCLQLFRFALLQGFTFKLVHLHADVKNATDNKDDEVVIVEDPSPSQEVSLTVSPINQYDLSQEHS